MKKDINKIATRILAVLLVENKEMNLDEITKAYNKTNINEEETRMELFYNGITYLLADGYIKETENVTSYKVTIKAKMVKIMAR